MRTCFVGHCLCIWSGSHDVGVRAVWNKVDYCDDIQVLLLIVGGHRQRMSIKHGGSGAHVWWLQNHEKEKITVQKKMEKCYFLVFLFAIVKIPTAWVWKKMADLGGNKLYAQQPVASQPQCFEWQFSRKLETVNYWAVT